MTTLEGLEKRVIELEAAFKQAHRDSEIIQKAQRAAEAQLNRVAAEQSEALRKEADRVTQELLEQTKAILKVSQNFIKLQSAVQKWAAAGTLAGAVVLYVIGKVVGL